MKTLLLRAFKVRSNKQLRKKEINNLGNTSNHSHGYPIAVIQNDISKVKEEQSNTSVTTTENQQDDVFKSYLLILPYKGKRGEIILRNITKEKNKTLLNMQKATVIYTYTKLGSNFNIKCITKKERKHNLVYSVTCP